MRPAGVSYCEAVTKKASESGWKLRLHTQGFQWAKDGKEETFVVFGPSPLKIIIHEACKWIDDKEGWKVHEELKFEAKQPKID